MRSKYRKMYVISLLMLDQFRLIITTLRTLKKRFVGIGNDPPDQTDFLFPAVGGVPQPEEGASRKTPIPTLAHRRSGWIMISFRKQKVSIDPIPITMSAKKIMHLPCRLAQHEIQVFDEH